MPTILRLKGYRFFWFSNESREPIHIHVIKEKTEAKFWLSPVRLRKTAVFRNTNSEQFKKLIEKNEETIKNAWNSRS
jgi:tRNA G10  N-methylase Trm11